MIASSSGSGLYYETYEPSCKEKEEIEEEVLPVKVNVFKVNNRNIIRQNKFNSKGKFRIHRTRNR